MAFTGNSFFPHSKSSAITVVCVIHVCAQAISCVFEEHTPQCPSLIAHQQMQVFHFIKLLLKLALRLRQ